MIFPRRLMTPSTVSGALGTAVISGTRTISRTEPMRTPNVSFPMRNPTTWMSFSITQIRRLLTRLGVFHFSFSTRFFLTASFGGFTTRTGSLRFVLLQNEPIHAVQEVPGELEHLLGGGREFSGTGRRLLDEFAHLVHRAHDSLRSGSLFLDSGINFLRNFCEATCRFRNLRGADRLLVGGGANFLRKLVDFGNHVGDFVQRGTEIVSKGQPFFDDARAALHIFDRLTRLALNALDQVSNFLGGLRRLLRQFAYFIGNDAETESILSGSCSLDRRVQRQTIGLLRKIINHFDNFADVVGAMAQNVDNLRGRLNGVICAIEAVGGFLHVAMPLTTSSRERFAMSSNTLAVSATRLM